ncbi:MAG: DUF4234 domain-containing protein [Proteobacteria bacterium]|nr:DUF4234 domain-containing protein [Pseudomonadota bacterium]
MPTLRLSEQDRLKAAPDFIRPVTFDIILTLMLCGLWNFWVQARQMRAVNFIVGERKYKFWRWFLLCLITCGLYHIYHEYRLSQDIAVALGRAQSDTPIVHLLLCLVGLSIVTDALQQAEINQYFGDEKV